MTDRPPLVAGADAAVVAGQLHRPPHEISAVVLRCPFGFPAVVENLPYDAEGRPFPTLYYCTCPSLVAAVSRLESDGGVARWTRKVATDANALRSVHDAARLSFVRRTDLARIYDLAMIDDGDTLGTGVGGVGDVRAVKCLHAHVAHALARPGYTFGDAILADVAEPWCADRRCAAYLPAEPGASVEADA